MRAERAGVGRVGFGLNRQEGFEAATEVDSASTAIYQHGGSDDMRLMLRRQVEAFAHRAARGHHVIDDQRARSGREL